MESKVHKWNTQTLNPGDDISFASNKSDSLLHRRWLQGLWIHELSKDTHACHEQEL